MPQKEYIFRTFKYFGPQDCKLCLLGQDPYPGSTIVNDEKVFFAEGLSFSINPDIKKYPGSLRNIYKESQNNYPDISISSDSLMRWVKEEHILLLNTALTVEERKPNIHSMLWKTFTDDVIKYLSENSECLFLLMGNNAKSKMELIDDKSRIITCVHPSPLSASRGFFNSKVFKNINKKFGN